jgi:hypothetical protein
VDRTAYIQVLGAIAYGELKAHDGAKARADLATDEAERRWHRQVAAEELRHHKGFVRRLEALGADPERAMRPFRGPLDDYHARRGGDLVDDAVAAYLGEGVADDLLRWLRVVADPETADFVDSVLADEEGHEAAATAELRELLERTPGGHRRAAGAARRMHLSMVWSGRRRPLPFAAFVRVGKPLGLIRAVVGGQQRRLRAIGVGLPIPALPSR